MTVINLEPKEVKPDLVVNYKDVDYILPGTINSDFLEITLGSNDGSTFLKAFMQCIIPAEMKVHLPQDDIMQLANIWSAYVSAPKDSSSNE